MPLPFPPNPELQFWFAVCSSMFAVIVGAWQMALGSDYKSTRDIRAGLGLIASSLLLFILGIYALFLVLAVLIVILVMLAVRLRGHA